MVPLRSSIAAISSLAFALSGSTVPSTAVDQSADPSPPSSPTSTPGIRAGFWWADYDGDGLQDAFAVGADGMARLLRNRGDGTFEDVTLVSGLDELTAPSFAAWHDFDRDGAIDLFVGSHAGPSCLLRNARDGTFQDVTQHVGLALSGRPLAARWLDYDLDGLSDLAVRTDVGEHLYHAMPTGLFETVDLGQVPPAAMIGGSAVDAGADEGPVDAASFEGTVPTVSARSRRAAGVTTPAAPSPVNTAQPPGSYFASACPPRIEDANLGGCLQASALQTLGMLYPLTVNLNVSPSGNVGINTTTPTARLDVNGTSMFRDVATIGSGAHLRSESAGGARLLGEQGDTPQRPAIGFFSTNGVDDGGGGNGIYRPLANSMAFATSNTERMRLTPGGSLGIGTATPAAGLHLSRDNFDSKALVEATGASHGEAGLSLKTATSPSAWEIFMDDVTYNSLGEADRLGFFYSGTGTVMTLDGSSGNVGMGTTSPTARLDVNGTSLFRDVASIQSGARLQSAAAGGARILGEQGNTPQRPAIGFFSTNGVDDGGGGNGLFRPVANAMAFATSSLERMRLSGGNLGIGVAAPTHQLHLSLDDAAKPSSNTWTISSDERLKKNIEPLVGALDRLLALRGVTFDWIDPASQGGCDWTQIGLIAQEVERVFPHWIGTDDNGYKTLTVSGFEALTTESLRELRSEKDAEIAALHAELDRRGQQLDELRAAVNGLIADQTVREQR